MFDFLGIILDIIKSIFSVTGKVALKGVKKLSGDSEREKWIKKLEEFFDKEYRPKINNKVEDINREIPIINEKIDTINFLRKEKVGPRIFNLQNFLAKFGNIKTIKEYTGEDSFLFVNIPQQRYDEIGNYIQNNHLSTSDIVKRIVCNLFSIREKNRQASFAIQGKINELKVQLETILHNLELRKETYKQNQIIEDMYIQSINMILDFIDNSIIPELELVESFFQANKLKDEILAGNELIVTDITFNYQIKVLSNTPYERHYMFIKNTFMFYIIACKIYSSPILTRLLQNKNVSNDIIYQDDKNKLEQQIFELENQKNKVSGYLTRRGATNNVE